MRFHAILWPALLFASAAVAGYINEPPSIPSSNLYMAGSSGNQAEDSGLAAAAVSTGYTTHNSSANVTLSSGERVISVTRTWSAARTWTLACAGTLPAGQSVQIVDPARLLSSANPLTIVPASSGCSDTLNGLTTNIALLTTAGSRAIATSDGTSNWSVTVIQQPGRTLDFVADFGGVPATAIGTTDCEVVGVNVTCPHTNITSADIGDQFEAQAIGMDGSGHSDGTTLISTIATVTSADSFRIGAAPLLDNSNVSVIDSLMVADPGSGYSFGSTQSLAGGDPNDIPITGATPKLMTVVDVMPGTYHGSGPDGFVTLTLAPSTSTVLEGAQATFRGHIVGGTLSTITLTNGAFYRAIDSSYTYDSSGWYEDIPVTGGGLTGATVHIKFGVVTEVVLNAPNVYKSSTIPCSSTTAASTHTSDAGDNLLTLTCSAHRPLVSFGHDNQAAIQAVNKYESDQIALHEPVCVTFKGRFLSSPVDVAAHPINGGPCLEGDAQILSGIFIFPGTGGDIFPIVDANVNGSGGPVQMQVIDTDDPNHSVKAGAFISNLTFWGDWSSSVDQNAIKFYGFTQWATMMNVSSWNVKGCLICVGVAQIPGDTGYRGQIAESTFFNIRTEFTGDISTKTPAFGLDGVGAGAGPMSDKDPNSPNNDLILRYRTFDDNGIPLTIRPCVRGGTGHGAHQLTISELKVEESGMEYSPNATDAVQVGETTDGCNGLSWAKATGGAYTSGAYESGIQGGITFVAPSISNPAVGTHAFYFKGSDASDLTGMRIVGGQISATNDSHGMGLQFDVSTAGNVVDLSVNNTSDYNLIYSGLVNSGALEYDAHDNATTAFIDPGVNVMTVLRCALTPINDLTRTPLTACDGANGQLVDTMSTQTLTNKTLTSASLTTPTIGMSSLLMSPTAPTLAFSSGFGSTASISAANGTAAFQITPGGSLLTSTGVISLPMAANGWACQVTNLTRATVLPRQTGYSQSTATLTNYVAAGTSAVNWTAGDKLNLSCEAF